MRRFINLLEHTFKNELDNEIIVDVSEKEIDGVDGVLIHIQGPTSETESHVTRQEAEVIYRELGDVLGVGQAMSDVVETVLAEIDMLNESAHRVTVWSGATIPVLHNPSKIAFENFHAKVPAIRGLLSQDGNDLYIWDAGMAVHSNLIQELGLGNYDCVSYIVRHSYGIWSGDVSDTGNGLYKPAIQRVTPKVLKWTESDQALLDEILNDPMFDELTKT